MEDSRGEVDSKGHVFGICWCEQLTLVLVVTVMLVWVQCNQQISDVYRWEWCQLSISFLILNSEHSLLSCEASTCLREKLPVSFRLPDPSDLCQADSCINQGSGETWIGKSGREARHGCGERNSLGHWVREWPCTSLRWETSSVSFFFHSSFIMKAWWLSLKNIF